MKRGFIMNRKVWNNKLEMVEEAETLEEIIIASWNMFKGKFSTYQEQVAAITVIDKKKNEFYQKELEAKRKLVYTELLLAFINDEDSNNIIEKVSNKVDLEWWEIKTLILTKKNPNKVDRAMANYILKKYPQNDKKEKEISHAIREAKLKVRMAEQSECNSFTEFSKKYNMVPRFEIEQAYDLVRKYDNELYKTLEFPLFVKKAQKRNMEKGRLQYQQNKSIKIAESLEKGLTKRVLEPIGQNELATFCQSNHLPIILVKKYLGKLKDEKELFFNLESDEQLAKLLTYKNMEMEKAQPIIDDILAISCGQKKTIDYYYFYKNGFFRKYFTGLLSSSQLHSISYMFKIYAEKHASSFTCFADKDIYNYSKNQNMFLDDELITYDSNEFLKVVNELKKENIPLAKGLIVQKIKERKNTKNTAKIIVKKNNLC